MKGKSESEVARSCPTPTIIKQYREEHPELFQQAKAIRDVVLQKTTEEGGVI